MSARKKKPRKAADHSDNAVEAVPASWEIADWPSGVWPGNPSRGKRVCIVHRDSLIKHLALTRVERRIVVIGSSYMRWLQSHATRVKDFHIAPNEPHPGAK